MKTLLRLLGLEARPLSEARGEVALALVNRLTGTEFKTPATIRHAQCIDGRGHVRLYVEGGREYLLTVTELT